MPLPHLESPDEIPSLIAAVKNQSDFDGALNNVKGKILQRLEENKKVIQHEQEEMEKKLTSENMYKEGFSKTVFIFFAFYSRLLLLKK